jgi:hypothetical protein
LAKDFRGILNDFFLNTINNDKKILAKNMRYQTKASAVMVIKAPKIAVKPQIKTIRCRFK